MKLHHLNCGTLCPVASRFFTGKSGTLVCHCLLVETESGLVLIDTGFGTADLHDRSRLSRSVGLMGPKFSMRETAVEQVKALGFKTEDVRHIILTHLDFDHAGGMSDFPKATVHLYRAEYEAANAFHINPVSRERYRPVQWSHAPAWSFYSVGGEKWNGFEAVRGLKGLPPEVLLIPLAGHTHGHCGVAVDTGDGWLLHAGDAYFYHREMEDKPSCTPGLAFLQKVLAVDDKLRRGNQQRLRSLALAKNAHVDVFCSHDVMEFERASRGQAWRAAGSSTVLSQK